MTETAIARGWRENADALAEWAEQRLKIRGDAYGEWVPRTGAWIAAKGAVTRNLLVRHFRGEVCLGMYSTSIIHTSKWAGLDIDAHESSEVAAARKAMRRLHAVFRERKLNPIIEDSDGEGGGH